MATLRFDHACARCGERHAPDGFCAAAARGRTGELLAGKYQLGGRLGAGGMGEVYEARHTFIGRRVAIKLLLPQYAQQRDMLARFQREARAAGALESEHIAAVTDFGFAADGAPFLVMEYLEGEDLARVIARAAGDGGIEVGRAVELVIQACRGLAIAHRSGIIHRNLKPENLFVLPRSDGTDLLKILDFGIAKLRDTADGGEPEAGAGPGGATLRGTTRSGMALGTPCYMSPEQARGDHDIDHRTDINALGVILYELLSGRKPHTGDSYNAILFHILTQIPEPLARLREGLPPGLAEVVACAMAFDRASRFANAGDLAEALRPFGATTGRRSAGGRAPTPLAGSPQVTPQVTMARPQTGARLARAVAASDAVAVVAPVAATTPSAGTPRPRAPGASAPVASGSRPPAYDADGVRTPGGRGASIRRWSLIGVGVGLAAIAAVGLGALGPRPEAPAAPWRRAAAPSVVPPAPAGEARPSARATPGVAPPPARAAGDEAEARPAPVPVDRSLDLSGGRAETRTNDPSPHDRPRRRLPRATAATAAPIGDADSRDDLLPPRASAPRPRRARSASAAASETGSLPLDFDSSNPYDR